MGTWTQAHPAIGLPDRGQDARRRGLEYGRILQGNAGSAGAPVPDVGEKPGYFGPLGGTTCQP